MDDFGGNGVGGSERVWGNASCWFATKVYYLELVHGMGGRKGNTRASSEVEFPSSAVSPIPQARKPFNYKKVAA